MTTTPNESIKTVRILCEEEELIPRYASLLAAGADLRAHLAEPKILLPQEIAQIPTGVRLEIPEGFEVQIRPRSGLAVKHGVTVLNSPGTIDADYRGEIQVILINHSKMPFTIEPKMRIAQMVLSAFTKAQFIVEEVLSTTQRGEGRFGHTGTH